ncbi:MAG: S-layer homology domain-containing protein, partial [Acidimicrobiaceae bacterium]|nr:S-layer homology domain-containing protein [Acidimicrobiaceae bacterium]
GCVARPALYCPDDPVTRAQAASFLARAFNLPAAAPAGFADTAASTHAADIDALHAAAGAAAACATEPLRYCPNEPVTRAQFASSLTTVAELDIARPDTQPVPAAAPPRRVEQIDVGLNHACALYVNGVVDCWGEDANGQVSDWGRWRYESRRFASVSAGSFLTCGVVTGGSVTCWGYPERENGAHAESDNRDWSAWTADPDAAYDGWVNTPPRTVRFKPESLSVGNYHACAIQTSGVLSCWGKAGDARLVIPTEADGSAITDWTMVEAGFANACGIREGGAVVCFGRTTYDRSAGPSGAGPFIDVTMGVFNGCALAADGSVECWGGTGLAVLDPVKAPPPGVAFTEIEMATTDEVYYACGLDGGGEIHCWGASGPKQLDPLSGTWSTLSVGGHNACAVGADGRLGCWGADDGGLFSPPEGTFKQTDGGSDFSCAIRSDDTVACWGGAGLYGQIDPSEVPAGAFKQLAVGDLHACAIRSDDTAACWGWLYRETAGGPILRHPAAVAPAGRFKAISAGTDLTCGIKPDGTLQCWGATTHSRQAVPSGSFTHVAVGYSHVCAIAVDQSMECWGEALFFDREGDGEPDDIDGKGNHTATVPPSGTHRYIALSAGEAHTCAIRDDKKAVCWGLTADSRNDVPGSADDPQGFGAIEYRAIATGGPTNCAIRDSNGSLSCWNHEKRQYFPDGPVLAMTGFRALGAGTAHMCGIDRSGMLVCWGSGTVIPVPRRFPPSGFDDLAGEGAPNAEIAALGGDVFAGTECAPRRFCPDEHLQRWTAAVWMVRVLDGEDPPPTVRFDDVDGGVWWAPHVERLAELGVTAGCVARPALYCPDDPVTRAQAASFLARAFNLPAAAPAGFADTAASTHAADIDALHAAAGAAA